MILAVKEKTVCLQIRGKCQTNIKRSKTCLRNWTKQTLPPAPDCVMLFFPVTFPQTTFFGVGGGIGWGVLKLPWRQTCRGMSFISGALSQLPSLTLPVEQNNSEPPQHAKGF